MSDLARQWQHTFSGSLRQDRHADRLRDAALRAHLGDWTRALTAGVVETCADLNWTATALDHQADGLLPVPRSEYLALDVMAFERAAVSRWRFPIAVMASENRLEADIIAYSLEGEVATAQRYVDQLVAAGLLREITGKARNRIYRADEVLAALEAPAVL
jgi:hypothetical protein